MNSYLTYWRTNMRHPILMEYGTKGNNWSYSLPLQWWIPKQDDATWTTISQNVCRCLRAACKRNFTTTQRCIDIQTVSGMLLGDGCSDILRLYVHESVYKKWWYLQRGCERSRKKKCVLWTVSACDDGYKRLWTEWHNNGVGPDFLGGGVSSSSSAHATNEQWNINIVVVYISPAPGAIMDQGWDRFIKWIWCILH